METEIIKAEIIALRLIARAEQSTAGLARKLEKRGFESSAIDAVISKLTQTNLLNDDRFARSWLRTRLRFTRSPRRLLSALLARGIDRDEAEAALKDVLDEETEFALLSKWVKKYAKKLNSAQEEDKRSLKFQLKNEGFNYFVIDRFLEDLFSD